MVCTIMIPLFSGSQFLLHYCDAMVIHVLMESLSLGLWSDNILLYYYDTHDDTHSL